MKIMKIYAALVILLAASLGVPAQTRTDEKIFQDIKVLIFNEKWPEAQAKLEDFVARFPQSSVYAQAVYYKSKCLERQDGKEQTAISSYKEYLRLKDGNKNLAEDAEVSIIELAMKLYDGGDKGFVREVEDRLASPNKAICFYAAVQLSYIKEKRIADKSIPILKKFIEEEKSAELRDRAKIALMRVSPEALAGLDEARFEKKPRLLRILVVDEQDKKFEFAIPWAFADLALAAIPEEDKAAMRAKGYDMNKIIRDLQSAKGNILEINAEGKRIKIWIE